MFQIKAVWLAQSEIYTSGVIPGLLFSVLKFLLAMVFPVAYPEHGQAGLLR